MRLKCGLQRNDVVPTAGIRELSKRLRLRPPGKRLHGPSRGHVPGRLLRARMHAAVPTRRAAGLGRRPAVSLVRRHEQRRALGERVCEGQRVAAGRDTGPVCAALRGLRLPAGLGEGAVERRRGLQDDRLQRRGTALLRRRRAVLSERLPPLRRLRQRLAGLAAPIRDGKNPGKRLSAGEI